MSNQMPEMIPMPDVPDNSGRGAPPGEGSRQLSPEEERSVLLNFMGNMYGEAKKMDGNIIGESTTLKRGAGEEIKKQIEQVYAQPQSKEPQQSVSQPELAVPPPQPVVQQPILPIQQEVKQPYLDDNQLALNFDITEKDQLFLLIEKMSTRIDRLHKKVDDLTAIIKNSKVTSLPIKKQTKKKSVDNKEEV
tara:strand:+ start:117 stop:689 length:573 start_codon:yes stop_codon:yes gene_type:complete